MGWLTGIFLNIRFLGFSIHLRCSPGMFLLFNTALHLYPLNCVVQKLAVTPQQLYASIAVVSGVELPR